MDAPIALLPDDWDHGDDGVSRTTASDGRRILITRRRHAPAGFFLAEATGLAARHAADVRRTPSVFAVSARGIALEDLGQGRATDHAWRSAGAGLARLYAASRSSFGL